MKLKDLMESPWDEDEEETEDITVDQRAKTQMDHPSDLGNMATRAKSTVADPAEPSIRFEDPVDFEDPLPFSPGETEKLPEPLVFNDEADTVIDSAPDRKQAVQVYQNLEANVQSIITRGLLDLGADRRTATIVAKAWLLQNRLV